MTKAIANLAMCWVFVLATTFSCSNPKPLAEEENLLAALKKVQAGFQTNLAATQFDSLLNEAKQNLDTLKPIEKKNSCFFNEAKRSYASFEVCKKALMEKESAQSEKRKIDMETTLAFTLGFASVSLAKATECLLSK